MKMLKDRLQEVMEELGMRRRVELARFCNVSESSVSGWFKGTIALGEVPLRAFAAKTNYSLEWLADGTGRKYRTKGSGDDSANAEIKQVPQPSKKQKQPVALGNQLQTPDLLVGLGAITEKEGWLLTQYRMASTDGKDKMEFMARVAEKEPLSLVVDDKP